MNINVRIKNLRKELGLSQKAFGERISLGQAAVSWIEQGGNGVTEQNVKAICAAFNIREAWLRDGTGDMLLSTKETLVARLKEELHLNDTEIAILDVYAELPREDREAIINFAVKTSVALQDVRKAKPVPAVTPEDMATYEKVKAQLAADPLSPEAPLSEEERELIQRMRLKKESNSRTAG